MVTIDLEFKKLIDALTEQETEDLENSIRENGFNKAFPIILWKNHDIIIDGHNRYAVCLKLGVDPVYIEQEFKDRDEVKAWMIKAQLARRNLTPEQLSYYRGLEYNAKKSSRGGSKVQNDTLRMDNKLSKVYGVSTSTIKRDGKFSEAVDKICMLCSTSKQDLLSKFKKADILNLAELPDNKIPVGLEKLQAGGKTKKKASCSFSYTFQFNTELNKMLTKLSKGNEQEFIEELIREKYASIVEV